MHRYPSRAPLRRPLVLGESGENSHRGGLVEHALAAVAATEHMVPHAGDRGSGGPGNRFLQRLPSQLQFSSRPLLDPGEI